MGDTLQREFSLNPVDTGRYNPPPPPTTVNVGGIPVQQPQPAMPITRPSFLQSFLSNLGPALAGGLAQTGDPRFPFGTGMGGALQGIQQQQRVRFEQGLQQNQIALQQQAAQRQAQLAQSQIATSQAELSKLQQETPLDVQQKQLGIDVMKAQLGFYSDPGNLDRAVSDATRTLGKLDPSEQAQLDAAKQDAKLKRSFDPVTATVGKIAQDRFQMRKADETSGFNDYINDPNIDKGVKKNRATFISWKAKQNPMAVIAGNMLPQGNALDQQAELYSQTHEIPSGLSRSPGTIAAIINRAAQLHPDQNLAGNQAEYAAGKESLKALQKTFNQVTAFENTAIKNLDQVAEAGKKIPQLTTQFANTPVRSINSKVLGTPEMARFRTALLTAQTEAAKVLSSANATGVLSDQARREAEDVLNGNLPYPAMLASIEQLKTDFANRHQSYQMQIADIQRQLSKGGGSAPTARRVIDLTQ